MITNSNRLQMQAVTPGMFFSVFNSFHRNADRALDLCRVLVQPCCRYGCLIDDRCFGYFNLSMGEKCASTKVGNIRTEFLPYHIIITYFPPTYSSNLSRERLISLIIAFPYRAERHRCGGVFFFRPGNFTSSTIQSTNFVGYS